MAEGRSQLAFVPETTKLDQTLLTRLGARIFAPRPRANMMIVSRPSVQMPSRSAPHESRLWTETTGVEDVEMRRRSYEATR